MKKYLKDCFADEVSTYVYSIKSVWFFPLEEFLMFNQLKNISFWIHKEWDNNFNGKSIQLMKTRKDVADDVWKIKYVKRMWYFYNILMKFNISITTSCLELYEFFYQIARFSSSYVCWWRKIS